MGQKRAFNVVFFDRANHVRVEASSRREAVQLAYQMRRGTTGAEKLDSIVVTPAALELDRYTVSHTPCGGRATYIEALVQFVETLDAPR